MASTLDSSTPVRRRRASTRRTRCRRTSTGRLRRRRRLSNWRPNATDCPGTLRLFRRSNRRRRWGVRMQCPRRRRPRPRRRRRRRRRCRHNREKPNGTATSLHNPDNRTRLHPNHLIRQTSSSTSSPLRRSRCDRRRSRREVRHDRRFPRSSRTCYLRRDETRLLGGERQGWEDGSLYTNFGKGKQWGLLSSSPLTKLYSN